MQEKLKEPLATHTQNATAMTTLESRAVKINVMLRAGANGLWSGARAEIEKSQTVACFEYPLQHRVRSG